MPRSGGIAYAWDDALCDAILPKFREDIIFFNLVTCHDLKAAASRSMASWGANHEYISFVDVTEECRRLQGGVPTEACEMAELWFTYKTDVGASE